MRNSAAPRPVPGQDLVAIAIENFADQFFQKWPTTEIHAGRSLASAANWKALSAHRQPGLGQKAASSGCAYERRFAQPNLPVG